MYRLCSKKPSGKQCAFTQIAYNQGNDLFAYQLDKLLAGNEYISKYNTGYDIPHAPYLISTGEYNQTIISNSSRGTIRTEQELLYAHYHNPKSLDAPYVENFWDTVNNASGSAEGVVVTMDQPAEGSISQDMVH